MAVVVLAGCGGPEELTEAREPYATAASSARAAPGRPGTVPAEFVVTPHGYFHPSCVQEVADGDTLLEDGSVTGPAGSRRAPRRCEHPRYDSRGRPFAEREAAAAPPTFSGWVASVWSLSPVPVRSISASWRVPSAPVRAGSQTLYFFPGLEPTTAGVPVFILQPVLAWNGFNDQRWTIASWNCCTEGNVWHSAPVNVNAGDAITGSVTGSKCDARGLCKSWSIRTAGPRRATTLSASALGAALDWAFAGAFEAYNLDACDQLPASGGVTFGSVAVRGTDGAWLSPAWTAEDNHVEPACLTSVSAPTGATASISWTAP